MSGTRRRAAGLSPKFLGGRITRICRPCRRETDEFRCPRCKQPTERTTVYNGQAVR